ncbi:MAG: hypothetical protein HYU80_02200 [Candidatus Blackburnbacteria bacterium]|nr:hypothetical protein [Candidatus Blackburnbacteria bacterium]
MWFKSKDRFLLIGILYVLVVLVALFILTLTWLPPGYTLAGHDSGLPLDAKEFLRTRLYAWDDRLGFGLDNSVNLGSLTIHFFDWLSAIIAGVPYSGNYISVFFWLSLIFVSAFFFAYQLKDIFGKTFIFILPPLATFNFYIFQSVFMLERGKFGVFSAMLILLTVYFRVQSRKMRVFSAALISSVVFSIFNGGGLFGITLFGGVVLVLGLMFLSSLFAAIKEDQYKDFKRIISFLLLTIALYVAFNAYSLLPFFAHYIKDDPTAIFKESLARVNQEWLEYVSRSASYLNLFRFYGVPDWYGGWEVLDKADPSHPYASFYLNNKALVFISFLFPVFSFSSLLLARRGLQRRILATFGMIALLGIFLAAGSHRPLGFIYEFLMEKLPGFVLFRSAFYKFGIFYLFGMLVMLAFTISFLLERLSGFLPPRLAKVSLVVGVFLFLGLWFGYHWVLFDGAKVFAWKTDQATKVHVPSYVYDFSSWVEGSDLGERRMLLLPPVNKDWEADAYKWGYWSLSPLPYALSSVSILSNWHALTNDERALVNNLYSAVRGMDEVRFLTLVEKLNIGYFLVRHDVLVDSSWSAVERPENYQKALESFTSVDKIKSFGEWDVYKLVLDNDTGVYATRVLNIAPDKYVSLANDFFGQGHSIDLSATKLYKDIDYIASNKMEVYDCLSCRLERKASLQSLPEVSLLPSSIFYPLKERQEEELLSQSKDPGSKLADYLGLVLRRTAEQKRMIDMDVKEKYLMQNAKVIRGYLDKVYSQLESSPEIFQDFETASLFRDFLGPVERVLNDDVKSSAFKASDRNFIDETLGILWSINRINDFFAPFLTNPERWSNRKVYKIDLPGDGEYNLFFPVSSFPQHKNGETILPKSVELKKNNWKKTLKVEEEKDGWLRAPVDYEIRGQAELLLNFEELPNLLTIDSSGLEEFSSGKAACFRGNIANFDRKRVYEIRVWRTDRLRPARAIFKDRSFVYSEKHGFLQGEDSFEIPVIAGGGFARYVFFPSVSANIISLYVCSDNVDLPQIDKIEVIESFAPPIIGVTGFNLPANSLVNVDYVRANPTGYEAEVGDVQVPYVLVLNQKFNPSWSLSVKNRDGSSTPLKEHFKVDGYANGWLVNQPGAKKFQIEYTPQSVLRASSIFSLISVFVGISWLVVLLIRSKKNGN